MSGGLPFEQRRETPGPTKSETKTWTYVFITEDNSRIKIGHHKGKNPNDRKSSIETAAGVALKWVGFLRDMGHETVVHRRCKKWRMKGEWFEVGALDEAIAYINSNCGELGEPTISRQTVRAEVITETTRAVQIQLPGFPYKSRAKASMTRAVMNGNIIPSTSATGRVEYYTPERYVESARIVMKWIDLDPASDEQANKTVKAKVFFSVDDDGLNHDWFGRVFVNPPWSGQAEKFVTRLLSEYRKGNVTEAILLVPAAYADRKYMRQLLAQFLVCLTDHRIKYGGYGKSSTGGDAFYYLGENRQRFIDEFTQYGPVMLRQLTTEEVNE